MSQYYKAKKIYCIYVIPHYIQLYETRYSHQAEITAEIIEIKYL